MKMTTSNYEEASADHAGFCTHCDAITTEDVEPNEEGLDCPECGNATVMSAENALVYEHIEISDELDEDEDYDGIISFSDEDEEDYA